MAAAAAIPSSQRVPPISHRFVVKAVTITATAPKSGPICMTRCAPTRSERIPKAGDRTSSAAKYVAVRMPATVPLTCGPPNSGSLAR